LHNIYLQKRSAEAESNCVYDTKPALTKKAVPVTFTLSLSVSVSWETFIRKDAEIENNAPTDGRDWGGLVT
jgi:hypothetical protein